MEIKKEWFRNFFVDDYWNTFWKEDVQDLLMQSVTIVLIIFVGMFALKVTGKKSLSQLTLPQSLFLIMYATTLGGLIITPQHFIVGILITIVIVVTITGIERLALKSNTFEKMIVGIPDVLYKNDEFVRAELRQNKISADQVEVLCRQKGIPSLEVVERVILEPNGVASIQTKSEFEQITRAEFEHAMNQILDQIGGTFQPYQPPKMSNLFIEADLRKNEKKNVDLE